MVKITYITLSRRKCWQRKVSFTFQTTLTTPPTQTTTSADLATSCDTASASDTWDSRICITHLTQIFLPLRSRSKFTSTRNSFNGIQASSAWSFCSLSPSSCRFFLIHCPRVPFNATGVYHSASDRGAISYEWGTIQDSDKWTEKELPTAVE